MIDGYPWSYALHNFLLTNIFCDNRGIYVDVGANIGFLVIPIAERARIQCYAFDLSRTRMPCFVGTLRCTRWNP